MNKTHEIVTLIKNNAKKINTFKKSQKAINTNRLKIK